MQKALLRNRVFAIVTAVAMVFGSLSAVLAPATTSAASGGDLIKGTSLSTVYYYGYDGYRYTFPNEKTYMTWYEDFSGVETISDSDLADISLAGNVVYRPGSRWIKITSDDKVYAVSTNGTIHWIESEDVAKDYAGSDWASFIEDVPDVFFTDYTSGTSLTSAVAYDGMMYMDGSDYYIDWDGEARLVSADGREANRMQDRFFLDGDGITSEISAITDVAQQGGDTSSEVSASGDVTVSLSSSNPSGVTLPTNANTVEVLAIDLTAGSEATQVNEITVSMIGLSDASDVSEVYLYEGDTRLTESRSVNSSTRTATFGSLNLDLDAYETRTISVRVSLSASSGDELQFGIESADDIDADGGVDGSFPLEGETFSVSSTTVGTVTVVDTGTLDDPYLGSSDATIGKFKVTTATEAGDVQSITLKIDNAADHDNYKLWADDEVVATGEYIGDKLVVFDFDEAYAISKGQSKTFEVTADIGGEAGDTVKVYMDKAVDIEVIGEDYGFSMAATITGYDASTCSGSSSDECNYTTIQGGAVTFAFDGPVAGQVQVNSQDVTLLNFTLTSSQAMTVKDLDIIVYADDDGDNDPFDAVDDSTDTTTSVSDDDGLINGSSEANITNIRIVDTDTGEIVMGPLDLDSTDASGDDADQTIDFSDDFDMDAGETLNLAVMVDVDDTLESGTELGAAIDISGFQAEDVNGDSICISDCSATDVVPSTDIQGYAQEALSASLTISLASIPGDVSTVVGKNDLLVNAFNFVAGDGGAVTVTDLTLNVYGDEDGSGAFTAGGESGADVNDYISSCSLYDMDGNLLDGPEAPVSDGQTIAFSSINWTLAASENNRLDVYCNLAKPSMGTDTSDYFAFDLSGSNVTTVDENNNDVTPSGSAVNGGTSPTNVVTVNSSGSLSVAVAPDTPSADFLLTGTSDNHVATFRFTATTEDFTVDTVSITEEAAEDMNGTTDSSAYANNISLVTVEYPDSAGDTQTATATMVGNEATFSGLDMFVEYGDPANMYVYIDVPATDRVSGNATSNERIEIGLSAGTGDFVAYGADSGAKLSESDISALSSGEQFVVRETAPTFSLSSDSPTSGSGITEVLRFNVAANSNQDVVLDQLVFEINSTDNGGTDWNTCSAAASNEFTSSSFILYDYDDLTTALAASKVMMESDGDGCDTSSSDNPVKYIRFDLATPEVVAAGSTKTYSLYVDTTYASTAADDLIYARLVADPITSTYVSTGYAVSDTSGVAVTDTSVTFDGTLTANTEITAGDLIKIDSEVMLVTANSSNELTVVRGYLGTTVATHADNATISRLPSTVLWEDDGDTTTSTDTDQYWGSYLVDGLNVTGHTITF